MNDELSYIYYAFSIISYFQMNVVFLFKFPIPQRDVSFDYPPYFGSYSKKTGGRFRVPPAILFSYFTATMPVAGSKVMVYSPGSTTTLLPLSPHQNSLATMPPTP